ncbi:hypothetical protein [Seonamhaeicola sp. ML3]|uniref:hypothetical protein n=1 Tax=Seonamhaeicola sp. ML3 TaxID=2937786 RepID=UPI00200EA762|nr:hypothetical protein [Seonamhaeicola sp. ML3]
MNKEIEALNKKKKEYSLKLIKDYLSPPIFITILALFIHLVFDVSLSTNYGVIIGIWVGTILRIFLFDFRPSYVYSIEYLNGNLSLYLVNPIGKSKVLEYSKMELDSFFVKRKSFWKAYGKIYVQKNGLVRNYNIVDSQLTNQYLKIQKEI